MALIRVPQEAQPLLALCRKHEHGPAEQAGPPCFETYADLIVFAASYGFAEMNGRVPSRKTKFLDRPNPIDLSTFKTDKRYPQILLIAMTTSRDQNVVRDEEVICRVIEDFAAVGCGQMAVSLKSISSPSAHLALAAILIGASETTI
jgi:dnd system-associated protein 4